MKIVSFVVVAALLISAESASAKPLKTRTTDMQGTVFIVTVDWDTKKVSVSLKANPAKLQGDILEQQLQLAVYYGSAVDCSLSKVSRTLVSESEVSGKLDCPWFHTAFVEAPGS